MNSELLLLRNAVREIYGPLIPTSKLKREEILEKVRNKVEFYKPKIEEKCNIDLGEILVKDYDEWLKDWQRDNVDKEYVKPILLKNSKLSKLETSLVSLKVLGGTMLLTPFIWSFMNIIGADMKHYNSSIYVPFYFKNRLYGLDFEQREKQLDQSVVHELSHNLWYKLGGRDSFEKNGRVWNEGFASYLEQVYFSDLYQREYQLAFCDKNNIYSRGREKIEALVQRYGKEIVLQVPKRWQEFEISFQ